MKNINGSFELIIAFQRIYNFHRLLIHDQMNDILGPITTIIFHSFGPILIVSIFYFKNILTQAPLTISCPKLIGVLILGTPYSD
jgi:hypothetical protein